jgi:hypothetical protein
MALNMSPGVFLMITLLGRIHMHYHTKQSPVTVNVEAGEILAGEGIHITSDKCPYRVSIDIDKGLTGKLNICYWRDGEMLSSGAFDTMDGTLRNVMFLELCKVLDGEVVFED